MNTEKLERLIIDTCIDHNARDYSSEIAEMVKSGMSFMIDTDDSMLVITPCKYKGSPCVHVDFFYSYNGGQLINGINKVSKMALDIGANVITFITSSNEVANTALRYGCVNIGSNKNITKWLLNIGG